MQVVLDQTTRATLLLVTISKFRQGRLLRPERAQLDLGLVVCSGPLRIVRQEAFLLELLGLVLHSVGRVRKRRMREIEVMIVLGWQEHYRGRVRRRPLFQYIL